MISEQKTERGCVMMKNRKGEKRLQYIDSPNLEVEHFGMLSSQRYVALVYSTAGRELTLLHVRTSQVAGDD